MFPDERGSLHDGQRDRQVGERLQIVLGGEERDAAHLRRRGSATQGGSEAAGLPARPGIQNRSLTETDLSVLRGEAGRRLRVQRVLPERLQEYVCHVKEV